jgi:acetylornithine deacetylase/succinyl-diaminopimelate desuccinylase-like protein
MGAILENDDAILKWAYLATELVREKARGALPSRMELVGHDSSRRLVLEGGQGFLPTHPMGQVQERMSAAFHRGIRHYLTRMSCEPGILHCSVTYDKLHNDAFAGDPDSATFRTARAAAVDAGMADPDTPVRGWDVSCDARLFAGEYPDMPAVTAGVGELSAAHSDSERIFLPDLWKAVCFCALFVLRETGSEEVSCQNRPTST